MRHRQYLAVFEASDNEGIAVHHTVGEDGEGEHDRERSCDLLIKSQLAGSLINVRDKK